MSAMSIPRAATSVATRTFSLLLLELLEGAGALALGLAAVDGIGFEAAFLKVACARRSTLRCVSSKTKRLADVFAGSGSHAVYRFFQLSP
jgi:hypothetical protein